MRIRRKEYKLINTTATDIKLIANMDKQYIRSIIQDKHDTKKAFEKFKIKHPESDIQNKISGYHVTAYGICIELADKTGISYVY